MPDDSGGEKTIPATPQKRQKQREDGNIAKSQDLNSAVALLVALGVMVLFGREMFHTMLTAGSFYFSQLDELLLTKTPIETLVWQGMYLLFVATGPFMAALMLAGLAVNYLQVGFLFTGKPLVPKFGRLNPISGFKKFFSLRSLVELAKNLAKLGVVGGVAWFTLYDRVEEVLSLMLLSPLEVTMAVAGLTFTLWWRIALAMVIIAIIDYAYQRWQYDEDIKMTEREFRDETKNMEGDPHIKRRIRQLQRQMAMQRMMADVPTADVVITNPVRYAIALRYDMATMHAPVVVAKGMRITAERIRDLAVEHDVPIVQRPELARALYRSVEVGQPIQEDLFRAVAEVLSFVYGIDQRAGKRRERDAALRKPRMAV
jgi:flagellar biosynthetic protein FlhB